MLLINSITRDAALFRLGFIPLPLTPTLVTLTFLRVSVRQGIFTAVRLLSVYFGLDSRQIFAVRD